MIRALLVMTMLGLTAGVEDVWAWGVQGHRVICKIAFELLSPQGKTLVQATRALESFVSNPDREPKTTPNFEASCVWPDDARDDTHLSTYEYHFINVPKAASALVVARDCAALDCALVAIQRYAQYLARTPDGNREKGRKAEALRFLGHFIADLHQPLHVGNAEDRGGNNITVQWFGQASSLHTIWDSLIADRGHLTTQEKAVTLASEITPQERQAWETFEVIGWARESFERARQLAYVHPDGSAVVNGADLKGPYFDRALPVVKEQLKKAGVRLAFLLNAVAHGTLPPNLVELRE